MKMKRKLNKYVKRMKKKEKQNNKNASVRFDVTRLLHPLIIIHEKYVHIYT